MEEFKPIKNIEWLEGCEVSNYGRIRKPNGQFYPRYYNNNTAMVCEYEGEEVWKGVRGRTASVAKIMCAAFYDAYTDSQHIRYINGVACDVRLDNITYKEKLDITLGINKENHKQIDKVNNQYIDREGNTVILYRDTYNYMKEFVEWLKDKEVSDNTIRTYYTRIEEYFQYNDMVTKAKINEFKKVLLAKGKAPKTVNLYIGSMKQYLIFLSKHLDKIELYKISTELKPLKIQQTTNLEHVITERDLNKLLDYCKSRKRIKHWYYMILTLATTGARVSEFTSFKIEGVMNGCFDIIGKGGKYRKILLPKSTQDELKEYVKEFFGVNYNLQNYLWINCFGKQISTRGVAHQLKILAEKAGVKDIKSVHPHSFRHYFAKTLLDKTKDISFVSNMLGHSSVATTSIYTKKSLKEQQRLLNKMGAT